MAVKFQSNFKGSQPPLNNNTFVELSGQSFMLCQNFTLGYTALQTRNFWFGGTPTDSNFSITNPYNRFYCVADFYITQVHTYSSQIFNVGEEFILSFIGDSEGVLATCDITRSTAGMSVFDFDGRANQPIQFLAGNTYYMQGLNNQYANGFILYQLTATAQNGIY